MRDGGPAAPVVILYEAAVEDIHLFVPLRGGPLKKPPARKGHCLLSGFPQFRQYRQSEWLASPQAGQIRFPRRVSSSRW